MIRDRIELARTRVGRGHRNRWAPIGWRPTRCECVRVRDDYLQWTSGVHVGQCAAGTAAGTLVGRSAVSTLRTSHRGRPRKSIALFVGSECSVSAVVFCVAVDRCASPNPPLHPRIALCRLFSRRKRPGRVQVDEFVVCRRRRVS